MLGKIFGFVTSLIEPIIQKNIFSYKRHREPSPDSGFESGLTPPKKRKVLHDISQDDDDMTSENVSQDSNFISKPQKIGALEKHDSASDWFRTPSAQSYFSLKENRISTGGLRFKKTSPYKKSCKPPSHCKSPVKQNNRKMSSGEEDVLFLGAVKKKPKQLRLQTVQTVDLTSTPPSERGSCDGSSLDSKTFPRQRRSLSSQSVNSSSPQEGIMSHLEYSQVLGTFIKATSRKVAISKPNPPKDSPPVAILDLTREGEDSDIVETVELPVHGATKKINQRQRVCIDLTSASKEKRISRQISLDSDEDNEVVEMVSKAQISPRQGSQRLREYIDLTRSSQEERIRQSRLAGNESHPLKELVSSPCSSSRTTPQKSFVDLTNSVREESSKILQAHSCSFVLLDETSEDEESSKAKEIYNKRVESVNSLHKRLQKIPFAAPEWIRELSSNYEKKMMELAEEKKEAEKLAHDFQLSNKFNVLKWTENRMIRHCQITGYVIPIEEKVVLPELTPKMKDRVRAALRPDPPGELLAEGFGYQLRRRDIHTLRGLNWLNDEVINFYMSLLMERGKENKKYPSIYAFNTFFYPKLVKQGHSSLKRWTRKVDIFSHDLIIVPVHLQMHWCLAAIDFKQKVIRYFDSMGHPNYQCLSALLEYLSDEYKDKKSGVFEKDGWTLDNVKDIPQQKNGSDCGMFACTFAEFICRQAPFTFSQDDMPYFREKMVYEILTSSLMIN